MTLTIDWGAVLAFVAVGGVFVAVSKLVVRDEIRKATNGKFAKIDHRLDGHDVALARLERAR